MDWDLLKNSLERASGMKVSKLLPLFFRKPEAIGDYRIEVKPAFGTSKASMLLKPSNLMRDFAVAIWARDGHVDIIGELAHIFSLVSNDKAQRRRPRGAPIATATARRR